MDILGTSHLRQMYICKFTYYDSDVSRKYVTTELIEIWNNDQDHESVFKQKHDKLQISFTRSL